MHVIRVEKHHREGAFPLRVHKCSQRARPFLRAHSCSTRLAHHVDFGDFGGEDGTDRGCCLLSFDWSLFLLNHDVTMVEGSVVDDCQPSPCKHKCILVLPSHERCFSSVHLKIHREETNFSSHRESETSKLSSVNVFTCKMQSSALWD